MFTELDRGQRTDRPRVTVVIPCYNRAASIGDAISSVLNQTFGDLELLVVDDGSTDGSVATIRAMSDPRIRILVHDTNAGANAARNTGVDAALGEYVAFNDSDDEWLPRKLELQLAALQARESEGYGACYCGMISSGMTEARDFADRSARYWPERGLETVEGDIYRALLKTSLVSTQTLLVRTDVIRGAGAFNPSLKASQDWELALRLARSTKFAFVERPLVLAHLSSDSLSKARWNHARTREFVLKTHYDAIAGDCRLLAFYHRRAADHFRHLGERAKERDHLRRAVSADPGDLRNMGRLALSMLTFGQATARSEFSGRDATLV